MACSMPRGRSSKSRNDDDDGDDGQQAHDLEMDRGVGPSQRAVHSPPPRDSMSPTAIDIRELVNIGLRNCGNIDWLSS